MEMGEAMALVDAEYDRAVSMYPSFHSPHEGLAVLLEEVEELKREVFTSPRMRSNERMMKEATQVGAMALRFLEDCCHLDKPVPK
jgi:hypothetical protein